MMYLHPSANGSAGPRSAGPRRRSVGKSAVAIAPFLALAMAISACASPTTGAGAGSIATPTASPVAAPPESTATAGTVSANTATTEEIVAALEAAGVANADRWAREIMEYRPYDTADPTLRHLQEELVKYNPDPATLAAILSVLEP